MNYLNVTQTEVFTNQQRQPSLNVSLRIISMKKLLLCSNEPYTMLHFNLSRNFIWTSKIEYRIEKIENILLWLSCCHNESQSKNISYVTTKKDLQKLKDWSRIIDIVYEVLDPSMILSANDFVANQCAVYFILFYFVNLLCRF